MRARCARLELDVHELDVRELDTLDLVVLHARLAMPERPLTCPSATALFPRSQRTAAVLHAGYERPSPRQPSPPGEDGPASPPNQLKKQVELPAKT